jgi:glycerol-3-phosphate dehydrogenase (NAD(P)+)
MHRIVIIGAGDIGKAIAHVLRPKKADIRLWDKEPGKVIRQGPLSARVTGAEIVFLCVPSFVVAEAAKAIRPFLNSRTLVVSIAKGIDRKSGQTADILLAKILPRQPVALLSGPMLANELLKNLGGAAIVASKSAAARKCLLGMFRHTELHVRTSADVRGVALAGVLKNIYALVLGASDGLGFGWNAKGLIAGEAAREMAAILPLFGGERETAHGLAGFGDLVATGMSPTSRNHETGRLLVQAKVQWSEGTASLPFIMKRLGSRSRRFPLLAIAATLLKNPNHGCKALKAFLQGA